MNDASEHFIRHAIHRPMSLSATTVLIAMGLTHPTGYANAQSAADKGATVLEPISVTAQEVAPGGVQIRQDQIERVNPTDIKDVFSGETSVNVGGGSDVSRKLYINGIEDTNLNVKIDGARQVNSAFHHLGTVIVDPGLLKAVRIETGVGPADVGPGALGGSIAYETKDARDIVDVDQTFGGFGKLFYDSNADGFSEVLTLAARHEGFEGLVYGSNDGGDNYEDGNGNEVVGTAPEMRNILGKFAWTELTGHRLELQGGYLEDEGIRPNRANFGALVNGAPPTLQEYSRQTFSASYVHENPTNLVNPEIVLSYNKSELFIDELAFGPFTFDLRSETTSYNGKFANTFTNDLGLFRSGHITAGIDFYHDIGEGDIEGGFGGPIPLQNEETSTNVGAFLQARLSLTEQFRVSLGGRFDYQWFEGIDGTDITGNGPSANLNIEYDILPGVTPYAGAGTTYGGIPLGESAIYNFARQWTYDGLTSSRSANYKAGVKAERGSFSGDLHVYYTEIDDTHDRGSATRNTTRDLDSEGVNLTARYDYGAGFVRATFSHNRFRSNGAPLLSGSASFHGLQTGDLFTVEAGHEFSETGIRIGALVEAALEDDDNTQPPAESYTVVNIYGEWSSPRYDNVTLRVDVRNLFDETYVDRLTSGVDNAAVVPFNEPGRTFVLTASVAF